MWFVQTGLAIYWSVMTNPWVHNASVCVPVKQSQCVLVSLPCGLCDTAVYLCVRVWCQTGLCVRAPCVCVRRGVFVNARGKGGSGRQNVLCELGSRQLLTVSNPVSHAGWERNQHFDPNNCGYLHFCDSMWCDISLWLSVFNLEVQKNFSFPISPWNNPFLHLCITNFWTTRELLL